MVSLSIFATDTLAKRLFFIHVKTLAKNRHVIFPCKNEKWKRCEKH